jgi:uncharacterized protein YyaL (SSP411 family)
MSRSIAVLALVFVYAAAIPAPPDGSVTYVREHAGDAVKWQPWGKAALDRALQQDKPIALAAGSFAPHASRTAHATIESDAATVNLLNSSFVPVLLDRAENPAIAAAYAAASARSDSPELIIHVVTPDLEWLDAVSPSDNLEARLEDAARRWNADREAFLSDARLKVRRLRAQLTLPVPVDATDPNVGQPLRLSGPPERRSYMEGLQKIDRSALHDVLGGGFHRAVRDAESTVPFFDKTLDDQARLARVYLDASQILGEPRFAEVARQTLEYAVRDLQMRSGGFNASQQADSLLPIGRPVIVEGAFYLWEQPEILHTFGPKMGARLCERFGVLPAGNIPEALDPEHAFVGKNVLRTVRTDAPDLATAAAIAKMLDIRLKRPAPRRDEPVASSHARIVSALARGGIVLGEERFLRAAAAGGSYLERTLYDRKAKRLSRRPGIPADAEDYSAAVGAFVDLYESTFEPKWLDLALELQAQQDALFWNAATSRYDGAPSVPEPVRDFVVTPAALAPPNAASGFNLLRLAAITGRDELRHRAETAPVTRVIIFGRTGREDTAALLRAAHATFDPMRVIIHGGEAKRPAPRNVAIGSLQPNPDRTASAHVCRSTGCSAAFTDPQALAAALQ